MSENDYFQTGETIECMRADQKRGFTSPGCFWNGRPFHDDEPLVNFDDSFELFHHEATYSR